MSRLKSGFEFRNFLCGGWLVEPWPSEGRVSDASRSAKPTRLLKRIRFITSVNLMIWTGSRLYDCKSVRSRIHFIAEQKITWSQRAGSPHSPSRNTTSQHPTQTKTNDKFPTRENAVIPIQTHHKLVHLA